MKWLTPAAISLHFFIIGAHRALNMGQRRTETDGVLQLSPQASEWGSKIGKKRRETCQAEESGDMATRLSESGEGSMLILGAPWGSVESLRGRESIESHAGFL